MPGCSKIIVSGRTAAGKTTHCRLLAQSLGWRYVGMSAVMKNALPPGLSLMHQDWCQTIDTARLADYSIDQRADHSMSLLVRRGERLVVDAWLQPWLYRGDDAIRVWIESSFESRALKCAVSYLREGLTPERPVDDIVAQKDGFSAKRFYDLYGIDFEPDPDIFDMCLDNSSFISDASIIASDVGIAGFQAMLESAMSHVPALSAHLARPPGE